MSSSACHCLPFHNWLRLNISSQYQLKHMCMAACRLVDAVGKAPEGGPGREEAADAKNGNRKEVHDED